VGRERGKAVKGEERGEGKKRGMDWLPKWAA